MSPVAWIRAKRGPVRAAAASLAVILVGVIPSGALAYTYFYGSGGLSDNFSFESPYQATGGWQWSDDWMEKPSGQTGRVAFIDSVGNWICSNYNTAPTNIRCELTSGYATNKKGLCKNISGSYMGTVSCRVNEING